MHSNLDLLAILPLGQATGDLAEDENAEIVAGEIGQIERPIRNAELREFFNRDQDEQAERT